MHLTREDEQLIRQELSPQLARDYHYERRGKIRNRVDIDDRSAVVERRIHIGDGEGDTVMGKGHTADHGREKIVKGLVAGIDFSQPVEFQVNFYF